jgi:DNA (cytosine-5)-methyltransferase 1
MQVVSPEGNSVPTIRKGYAKGGSTDVLLQHPTNPDLLRQFTVSEHATIKQVSPALVAGLSNTLGHQILGQGIVYSPFVGVGSHIGDALNRFVGKPGVVRSMVDINVMDVGTGGLASAAERLVERAPVTVTVEKAAAQQSLFADAVVNAGEYSGVVKASGGR